MMQRRDFLKAGAAAATAGTIISPAAGLVAASPANAPVGATAPAVLADHLAADHRKRLENVGLAQRAIRTCLRKHQVTSYLPGQCCYNLGEYPCRKPWDPDDWDERELDSLRDHGIGLIHVHEDWNDSQRLFGSHKLDALNPAGFRRFVEMVHRRGMKLIVYASSGYFEKNDPDFREEWTQANDHPLVEIYFRYAHCSPASPGWRAYFLKHVVRILDDYGIDGIYNDLGYRQPPDLASEPTGDQVLAFEETAENDGALADLLALVYAEVHRRGGVVKVHRGGTRCPKTDLSVYDYLWVGEGARQGDKFREAVKDHPPYVVPCLDMSRATIANEDELYLHAIPYMQFPVLLAGRPFTGERSVIPGIDYPPEEKCFWTRHCRAIWKHYQAHPDGPHSYGWWDSAPGRPQARPTHARWLAQYLPMVEEGTWAWLEIGESDLFGGPLPEGVVASAFANRQLYLVLANYGEAAASVATSDGYVAVADPSAAPTTRWDLPGRSLRILRRWDV
ncbi:MAG: twin-arginine translocation signal domain-containing protein [Planctomycetes bacterium]|nr:twin-arginine translocation signal domain-containing protein [Planctomycetota bacterium]